MNGAKRCTEAADLIVLLNIQMVGERSMWGEALAEAGVDCMEVRMSA